MRLTRLGTILAGVALTLAIVVVHAADTRVGETARNVIYDGYLRAAPRAPLPNPAVVIVDIDEASLDVQGQWPWPRDVLAKMLDRLFAHGALAVGFDVIFPEPDRTSSGPVGGPDDHDATFAAALARGPTVLSAVGTSAGPSPVRKAGVAWTGQDPSAALTGFPGHVGNLAILEAGASGLGSISLAPARDGIVRRVPMLSRLGDTLMPALSVEMLRVAQGAGSYVLRTTEAQGEASGGTVRPVALRVGALTVPLDGRGEVAVRFSRDWQSRMLSAGDVLAAEGHDPALADAVADRLILVGSSAPGLFDIRATPLDPGLPGVVIHAEVLEQILTGDYLLRPDWMIGLELAVIALSGLSLTAVLALERPLPGLFLMMFWAGGSIAAGWWMLQAGGLVFDPIPPSFAAVAIYLPGAALGFVAKERSRRAIRARFAHFLPRDLLAQVADDPGGTLTPDGAERELTVMFIDMRNFSTVTEHMAPSEVVALVNTYLEEVTRTLLDHGATIDKYIGDAVMAFWNAPVEMPDHKARAIAAATALTQTLERLNALLATRGLPAIGFGAGVNTGPCFVGLMGSSDRLMYSCIGDSVNLAARLEGLTRVYGVPCCYGGSTIETAPDGMHRIELDLIAVKGRSRAEPVFAVLPATAEVRLAAAMLDAARQAYASQDWDTARILFDKLAARESAAGWSCRDTASSFLDRIARFRVNPPPPDWDGSHAATSK